MGLRRSGVENGPFLLLRPVHYTTACTTVQAVMNYMPAKYDVSMLNRSIDIQGVPKSPYLLTKFALRMRGIT